MDLPLKKIIKIAKKYIYNLDVREILIGNITLLIKLLLRYFGSDKFGERTNIPKLSENTIWELTAQYPDMCTLDIIQFAYIQFFWKNSIFFQDVSNSEFGPIL